jgi:translation initiation factor 2 alpha subunit (eIF-2alpha)
VAQGQPVNVKIIEVDGDRRRLSLSLKRVEDTDPVQPRADGAESVHTRPNLDLSEDVFTETPLEAESALEHADEPLAEAAAPAEVVEADPEAEAEPEAEADAQPEAEAEAEAEPEPEPDAEPEAEADVQGEAEVAAPVAAPEPDAVPEPEASSSEE